MFGGARTRKGSRSAGFTMIELLIVIFIGSILVGIALSGFQSAQAAFAALGAGSP